MFSAAKLSANRLIRILSLIALGVLSLMQLAVASRAPALTGTTIDLPHGLVFYVDAGKGAPIVLLHASNSLMWESQIAAFTHAGYRVIAVDYRGVSPGAGRDAASSSARINELMDHLGIRKFHLIGTGGAGAFGAQYALANPERIRSLTAANTLLGLRDKDFNEMEARLRTPPFDALPRELRELSPTYRAAEPEEAKRWLEMSNAPANGTPAANEGVANATDHAGAQPAALAPVTLEGLDEFKSPILALTCDADPYTPPSILRRFGARLKKIKYVIIQDCGHSAYWENPDAFNRAVLSFMSKH